VFARFRAIYRELNREPRWWSEAAWLRFAAHATVAMPGEPAAIAVAVRTAAAALSEHASWLSPWRSPLRFVLAALLVQEGSDARRFADAAGRLLHPPAGAETAAAAKAVAQAGAPGLMALWLLGTRGGAGTVGAEVGAEVGSDVEALTRLHGLHLALRHRHRWLIGAADLPACALLVERHGTVDELAAAVDGQYRALRGLGLAASVHLATAAHLLLLSGLPAETAAERYARLHHQLATAGGDPGPIAFDALALLALVDVTPEAVIAEATQMQGAVAALVPALSGPAVLDLAADLAFLGLVERDYRLEGTGAAVDQERARLLMAGRRAAAVLACGGGAELDPALP
jgi:hypothetical protein